MEETNPTHTPQKDAYLLPGSILIAALLISGSIIYLVNSDEAGRIGARTPEEQGAAQIAPGGSEALLNAQERDVILGDPKAPITIIEYGDYQCPFCARFFEETEPLIKEQYVKTGIAKMIYRDLAFLGPESTASAEAAECAKDQGKFWAYHDALYRVEIEDGREHNGNLNRDLFLALAHETGMDVAAFTACVDGKKYASRVKDETRSAGSMGVSATPTVFVNERKIQGAQPMSVFEQIIEELLSAG